MDALFLSNLNTSPNRFVGKNTNWGGGGGGGGVHVLAIGLDLPC